MRVSRRGLDLSVAQKAPDHGKGLAQGQGAAGVRMTEVVDPDIMKSSARPDDLPGVIDLAQVRTRLPAGYDPGIPLDAW